MTEIFLIFALLALYVTVSDHFDPRCSSEWLLFLSTLPSTVRTLLSFKCSRAYVHCHHLSSGMQWTKVSKVCRQAGPVFSNLVQAQAACSKLGPKCLGVYDVHCDGRRTFLWQATSFIKSGAAGCVHKLKETFQPTSGAELRKSAKTAWDDSPSVGSSTEEPNWVGDLSNYKFEKWNPSLPGVSFGDLHGSVIYAVRRMGWQVRQGGMGRVWCCVLWCLFQAGAYG